MEVDRQSGMEHNDEAFPTAETPVSIRYMLGSNQEVQPTREDSRAANAAPWLD